MRRFEIDSSNLSEKERQDTVFQAQLCLTTVDLNKLLDSVFGNVDREIQSRKIVWTRGALPVVTGDAALLFQVFTYLISNALKYSRQRDPAEIEIGSSNPSPGECTIFVRDNSTGFDQGKSDKLFIAFSVCMTTRNSKVPASAWPTSAASYCVTADEFAPKAGPDREPPSTPAYARKSRAKLDLSPVRSSDGTRSHVSKRNDGVS